MDEKQSSASKTEIDKPCHKEVTVLTPDLKFCPICGFYYSEKDESIQ